eukprot:gene6703-9457_t
MANTLPRSLVIALTVANCSAFFCLGLLLALLGPTLLDLATILDTSIKHMTFVFLARSIGYLFGSMIGGLVFDRTRHAIALLAVTVFLAGVSSFCVPIARSVDALAFIVSLQGLAMGFLDTGGNVLLIRCWTENCGPYLQTLHFCFGLGAFVAPLLAKRYIGRSEHVSGNNCSLGIDQSPGIPLSSISELAPNSLLMQPSPSSSFSSHLNYIQNVPWLSSFRSLPRDPSQSVAVELVRSIINSTLTSTTLATSVSNSTASSKTFESHVGTAYHIVAGILLPPSLAFAVLSFITPRNIMQASPAAISDSNIESQPSAQQFQKPNSSVYVAGLLAASFLFFLLYVGTEVSFGGYLYSFTVKSCDLMFSESDGALITSAYWGLFAVGRFLAIPMSVRLSPRTLMILNLTACLIASVIMVCLPGNAHAMWIGSSLFGLGMASVFPSGYHMVESYMDLTTTTTSVFVVGAALGEMLLPLMVGILFDSQGPKTFPVVIVGVIIAATVVFAFMSCWIHLFWLKHGNSPSYNIVSFDGMLEHDSGMFAIADSSDEDAVFINGSSNEIMEYDFSQGTMKEQLLH